MTADITCAKGCGACCDPVILHMTAETLAARDSPNGRFAAKHWHTLLGPEERILGEDRADPAHRILCDVFDPETRTCRMHGVPAAAGGPPPVCTEFPRYGAERTANAYGLPPQCTFTAEVRTMLPIVEVR